MNINSMTSIDALALTQSLTHARKGKEATGASAVDSNARVSTRSAPSATPSVSITPGAPPAPGPYDGEDMNNLLGDWSQNSSPYDIDGSGSVDVDDLIAMILNWQQPPPQTDPAQESLAADVALSEPVTGEAAASPANSLSPTIDADVTVDVALTTDDVNARRQATAAVPTDTTPTDSLPPPANGPYSGGDLGELTGEWGSNNSPYDLDGNGTVDVDDLINMILNWGSPPPAIPEPPAVLAVNTTDVANSTGSLSLATSRPNDIEKPFLQDIDKPNRPVDIDKPRKPAVDKQEKKSDSPETRPSLAAGDLRTVSASLVDRLLEAGFSDRPPTNLRALVDKLNLAPSDQSDVMDLLKQAYPDGLGVNVRA